ncbi:MAG: UvrD-helicase domain-containing protein [Bacilli bacterium]|nr:UvrD-helicase domain-containing protein [Bacilli bacterium]
MNINNLNSKQKEAVLHKEGPMLVLAGAGSGKTKVLTSRIAYLIDEGIYPANVLAITFTNKAAREMKARVAKLVGHDANYIQISTFHSLGLKIIKENYEFLGYDKNFTILDSDDTLTIIKKLMKELNMNPKFYNARLIRNKISSAKNELIDTNHFSKIEFDSKIVTIYKKYCEKLKQGNSVDFDDLLILPIKLFKTSSSILNSYQERYKYILIDEYQDTNEAQYIFSKMLAAKYKNIFVVGDNDQAIYAFRGANFKNILNFEKDYPNCITILLEENYRSTQTILNAANSVIKHNKQRKDKKLWSNNDIGEKIKYIKTDDEKSEGEFVTKEIKKLINEKKANYEDIAILYRTNAQSRAIEESMLKANIPYRIIGSLYFYNRKEIKDLLCYLRLINNPKDDVSLTRVINVPKRGIGNITIGRITEKAETDNISMFEAITSGKELVFKQIIQDLQETCKNLSLTEMVEAVLDKSGIREELTNEKTLENEIRLENLEEFKSITKNYEEEFGEISLDDFLNEISLVSDITEHTDGTNKVSLMTVHSVKGLEFDYVFAIGMEEGIFPHYNSIMEGTTDAIEEERRLCYVAITRAKKDLWIINCKKRLLYGQTQINAPSRFIEEIDKKYLEVDKKTTSIFNKISRFNKRNMLNKIDTNYQVGDHVKHIDYGEGIVINIDKSLITIAFPHPLGTKKFIKNHRSITKI